jgi:hypothetical protein
MVALKPFRFFSAKTYKTTICEKDKEVLKMELSEKKLEQLNKQPIVETSIKKSDDGKWIVHKTVITDIKPVSYFEKVLQP